MFYFDASHCGLGLPDTGLLPVVCAQLDILTANPPLSVDLSFSLCSI